LAIEILFFFYFITINDELIYCIVQVLEPSSAMRTVLSLDEALSNNAQFSALAARLVVNS